MSWGLLAVIIALGQEAAPKFEVVSIKAANAGERHPNGISGDRFALGPMPLVSLVMYAYDLRAYQIVGGPGPTEQNYVVDAKAPGGVGLDVDKARVMLEAALEDRFVLRAHRETRVVPV